MSRTAGDGNGRVVGNSAINTWNHTRVTVSSTATLLSAISGHTYAEHGIRLVADPANTDTILVSSSVSGVASGFPLAAGDALDLPITDLTTVAVDATVNNEYLHVFIF
jgi:hypothetical protein